MVRAATADPRRWRPLLLLAAASLALGVAITGRLLFHLGLLVPDTPFTDGHLIALAVGVDGFWSGELWSLHTTQAVWPEGAMYRPLLWPSILLALVAGPAASFALSWMLAPLANALGGYALGRAAGASTQGAALAGALMAWCPWVRVTLTNGQLEQSYLGGVAAVWAIALWSVQRPGASLLLPGVALLGVGLAVPHVGLAAVLGLPLLAIGSVVTGPDRRRRALAWLGLLVIAGLAALLIQRYHSANFGSEANLFAPRRGSDATHDNMASLGHMVIPPTPEAFVDRVVHSVYLGAVPVLAGLLALARWRRSLGMVLVACVFAVLALGSRVELAGQAFYLPLHLLHLLAPSMEDNGSAYRLVMGAAVALPVAVGLALPRRGGRVLAIVLVLLAWGESTRLPSAPVPVPLRSAVLYPELSALAGGEGAVLDLPMASRECDWVAATWMNSALVHDRPFLHDLSAPARYYEATGRDRVEALAPLMKDRCPEHLAEALQAVGVGAVVFHQSPCPVHPNLRRCVTALLGPPSGSTPEVLDWWILPLPGGGE